MAAAAMPAIRCVGVRKVFGDASRGGTVAVADVDLDIGHGEFFALLGPSGSGKTTVLRLIAGFEQPTAGAVFLDGHDVTGVPPYDRDVNTVFQDYALFPHMTVADNVGYGLMVKKIPKAERTSRVRDALDLVHLGTFGGRKPHQLSGGQRQRVALARALVNRPKVLLLDEPLGALDQKLREEMQGELKALQRELGITFVFVTHDQVEAFTMSDRIAVFNRGKIEQLGSPDVIYQQPATEFVAHFVGSINAWPGADGRIVTVRPERVQVVPAGSAQLTGTVTEVHYVGAEYRVHVALDDQRSLIATRSVDDTPVSRGERVGVMYDPAHLYEVPKGEP